MRGENAEPVGQSLLTWFFGILGTDALIVALVAMVAFVMTLLVVLRGKDKTAGAALIFIVPLPMLVSVLWFLNGAVAAYSVIAGGNVEIKFSEAFVGISASLVQPFFALLLTFPSYLLAMVFLFCRSIEADSSRQASDEE